MKKFRLFASTLAGLALTSAAAFAWEPTKPVEIVVAAGAGGASDQMARMMQAAVQKNNLMKQPMVVSLKAGASGAEAVIYVEYSAGDANEAMIAYLPYKSGGEAATQLVGNHTQSNVNNPSENLEVWRAGQVRALCVFDKERIQYKNKVTGTMSWNDIPTCKEEGVDVQYLM